MRPYNAEDAAEVAALLDHWSDPLFAVQAHPLHGLDRDGDRWSRTRVAVDSSGELIGAVTVARNRVHAGRYSLVVEVARSHRRRGVGRALVEQAQLLRPEALPLAAKIRTGDAAAVGFMAAVGGRPYQRCPCLRPDPTSADIRSWCASQSPPPVARLDSAEGLSRNELIRLWVDQYIWVHEPWSPVTSTALLESVAEEIADDMIRAASSAAWVAGRVAALAWAVQEPAGEVTVVAETTGCGELQGQALVAAVLADCLRRLAARNVRAVEIDGHDSDPHLAPVVRSLPMGTPADPLLLVEVP